MFFFFFYYFYFLTCFLNFIYLFIYLFIIYLFLQLQLWVLHWHQTVRTGPGGVRLGARVEFHLKYIYAIEHAPSAAQK